MPYQDDPTTALPANLNVFDVQTAVCVCNYLSLRSGCETNRGSYMGALSHEDC